LIEIICSLENILYLFIIIPVPLLVTTLVKERRVDGRISTRLASYKLHLTPWLKSLNWMPSLNIIYCLYKKFTDLVISVGMLAAATFASTTATQLYLVTPFIIIFELKSFINLT